MSCVRKRINQMFPCQIKCFLNCTKKMNPLRFHRWRSEWIKTCAVLDDRRGWVCWGHLHCNAELCQPTWGQSSTECQSRITTYTFSSFSFRASYSIFYLFLDFLFSTTEFFFSSVELILKETSTGDIFSAVACIEFLPDSPFLYSPHMREC